MSVPPEVVLPLAQGYGAPPALLVKPGDEVRAGQVIALSEDSVSSPLCASISGQVEEIITVDRFGEKTEAVVIRSDGTTDWICSGWQAGEWQNMSQEKLEELLYHSGVTSLGSSGIPTRFKSSPISADEVEHVIVSVLEDDVFNPSCELFVGDDQQASFAEGLEILRKIMPQAVFHLAVDKRRAVAEIEERMNRPEWLTSHVLTPRYPQSRDELLVATLLAKTLPFGFSPANLGVIVLDAQAVGHVHDAVVRGKPLIDRIVALSGPGFKDNFHVRVRIGTSIATVLKGRLRQQEQLRIVHNSLLAGETVSDSSLPVGQDCASLIALVERETGEIFPFSMPGFKKDSYSRTFFSSLFLFPKVCDSNVHGEERACISCGFCEDVCPVGILPHLLHRYVKKDIISETLGSFQIFRCIDCNLCTYVCTSKIEVAGLIKEGKERLIEEGVDPSLYHPGIEMKDLAERKD
jgi:Na(+)-translocating NADH:ubiquinone oxidoreductase A subunit